MGVRLLVLLGLIGHAIRDRMSRTSAEAELTTSTAGQTESGVHQGGVRRPR
jgi:hypothetical protein